MAWVQVGITTGGNKKEYQSLSTETDPKPTDCGPGSTCLEVDTGKGWLFDPNVNPATNNHWWSV